MKVTVKILSIVVKFEHPAMTERFTYQEKREKVKGIKPDASYCLFLAVESHFTPSVFRNIDSILVLVQ